MALPQLFPRVKAYLGTITSPLHGRDLRLAQADDGFILVDLDVDDLVGSFTRVPNDVLAKLNEEMKNLKLIAHNDKSLIQRAKAWSTSLAKLPDERLEQLLYSGLLILARQRKVLIQTRDHRLLFRRLNRAASVEVNGVANVFDSGGLTIARLPAASFDRLVSAALGKGYVSSDLVREVLPAECRARKELAFSMAKWLHVYLELDVRG